MFWNNLKDLSIYTQFYYSLKGHYGILDNEHANLTKETSKQPADPFCSYTNRYKKLPECIMIFVQSLLKSWITFFKVQPFQLLFRFFKLVVISAHFNLTSSLQSITKRYKTRNWKSSRFSTVHLRTPLCRSIDINKRFSTSRLLILRKVEILRESGESIRPQKKHGVHVRYKSRLSAKFLKFTHDLGPIK